ncbi:hypothetical protein C4B38_000320 [Diabrotica virgifera virgifera]|nr:hypothetical protein C4B38_000320 [Diabrotica virgifera virgifera]
MSVKKSCRNFVSEEAFVRDRTYVKLYGTIFRRWASGLAYISLSNPEDIELLLNNTKHLEKDVFYDLLQNWLGQGLLTSKGVEWHKRRKILTPAFHFSILQEFAEVFNKEVSLLVEDIKKSCSKPYIDVVKPISEFTLYSIGETSLGKDLRDDPKCDEYKQAVYDYGDHYMYRMIRPWLHGSFLFNLTKVGKKAQKTCEVLHDFSNNIIRERYETLQKGADAQFAKKRLALLDLMIKAKYNGASIDDLGIREEVDTFILAGHDTTAVALGHILMLLANEQEAQEEIYQEIQAVCEDPNKPTFAELGEMKFAERCIKESLRLYPSAVSISRLSGEEIKTKTGYTIPKGCTVAVLIYDLHRNPEIWENPLKFDPDRFLPENMSGRHPYAYIPFSAGSRNCIGQKYAMLELKTAVCGLINNFKLEPVTRPADMRFKADIVLRPANEIRIKFVPRKNLIPTLTFSTETSLGKDLREEPHCDEYKQAVYEYGDNFVYRMVRPWLFPDTFFNLTKVGRRNKEIVKVMHDFSNGIIAERYKLFKKDGTMSYSERKRLALLDLMIKAKYNGADIDDVGIREEVDTFILGVSRSRYHRPFFMSYFDAFSKQPGHSGGNVSRGNLNSGRS